MFSMHHVVILKGLPLHWQFFGGIYSFLEIFNHYFGKRVNKQIIGLFKKVVWPERNGGIHWVTAGIPVVTVKFRFNGWLVGGWWVAALDCKLCIASLPLETLNLVLGLTNYQLKTCFQSITSTL